MSVTETQHDGAFLLSESNGALSRTTVTVVSGQDLVAGTVVGKVTASGKYKILNPTGSDGSEAAAGVLYGAVDASAADKQGVLIDLNAEVADDSLTWPGGITAGQKTTAKTELRALGIKVR